MRVGVDRELAAALDGQAQQPLRRVEPLGPGVDLDRGAVLDARGEHRLGVELALGPGRRAAPMTSRPVQWPRTSVCGLATAASMRAVIAAESACAASECTLATTTSSRPSSSSVWSRAAVDVDVDLDAGEDPERAPAPR